MPQALRGPPGAVLHGEGAGGGCHRQVGVRFEAAALPLDGQSDHGHGCALLQPPQDAGAGLGGVAGHVHQQGQAVQALDAAGEDSTHRLPLFASVWNLSLEEVQGLSSSPFIVPWTIARGLEVLVVKGFEVLSAQEANSFCMRANSRPHLVSKLSLVRYV